MLGFKPLPKDSVNFRVVMGKISNIQLRTLNHRPPNSSDLSPIESTWSILSTKVNRYPEPTILDQFKRRLRSAWNSVTSATLEAQVQSMPTRIAEVVRNK